MAESGSLLRSCVGDCTEGSNPSLSEMPISIEGGAFSVLNTLLFEPNERRPIGRMRRLEAVGGG